MGGKITARSIKGIGTEFTVDVKLGITEEEKLRHNLKKHHNFSHLKTLVVDDDVAVCESAVVTLHEMGVMAEWVDSGRKAVRPGSGAVGRREVLRHDPDRLEDARDGRDRDGRQIRCHRGDGGHDHHHDRLRLDIDRA